jgi:shikimate dehydrogenase
MAGGVDETTVAFPTEAINQAETVFDVVAFPSETPLILSARAVGKPVITGAAVIALQAAKQFELYTGFRPSAEEVLEASLYSRQPV